MTKIFPKKVCILIASLSSVFMLMSCGILTKGSVLDVVHADGSIQPINLAPRHYRVQDHCVEVLTFAGPNLLSTLAPLTPDQRARLAWPSRVANYKVSDCQSFKARGKIMQDFDSLYTSHAHKIGIILPPAAANEAALQLVLDEYKAALKRNGVTDDNALVIRRVEKKEDAALKATAEMIHMDRVSILVGVNSVHTAAMVKLADPAQVPVFIVNPTTAHSKSNQSMRVYPPVSTLAQKLVDQYKQRNVSHVTVLYPKDGDTDLLKQLKNISGSSLYFMESSYDPISPNDVLATVRGAAGRMALTRSKTQGLLILDNFKMVRHIVNIVRGPLAELSVVITGNQQWRSPALVTPREEALEGAMFVDFIGSYADLPTGLEVPMPESPYFTTAQAASRIDYQIIGHRLGTLSIQALRKNWSRQRIAKELQSLRNSWDNYFPVGEPAFNEKRDSTWPVFLFQIQGETIVPDNKPMGKPPALSQN